jgi:hypothetical protein
MSNCQFIRAWTGTSKKRLPLAPRRGQQTIQEPPISSVKNPAPHPKNPKPDETHILSLLTRSQILKKPSTLGEATHSTSSARPIPARGEREPDPRSRLGLERKARGAGSVPGAARWGMARAPPPPAPLLPPRSRPPPSAAAPPPTWSSPSLTSARLFESNWRAAKEKSAQRKKEPGGFIGLERAPIGGRRSAARR